jgi:hypothetical protein
MYKKIAILLVFVCGVFGVVNAYASSDIKVVTVNGTSYRCTKDKKGQKIYYKEGSKLVAKKCRWQKTRGGTRVEGWYSKGATISKC